MLAGKKNRGGAESYIHSEESVLKSHEKLTGQINDAFYSSDRLSLSEEQVNALFEMEMFRFHLEEVIEMEKALRS